MITKRIDNVTRIPEEYRTTTPPPPRAVKIELTGKCNYRCGFCPIAVRKDKPKDMDWNLFKGITKEMKKIGVEEIGVFFMGESFTNALLLENAIWYLKDVLNFPYVFLTSNASLASPEAVRSVMEAGLDSLKWSCNFSDKEQFKDVVGVKASLFDKALNNIKSAYEIREQGGYNTKLYASSIRYNDEQLGRMEDVIASRIKPYVDEHYWLPLYSMGSLSTARERELGLNPIAGNTGRYDNPVAPIPCWSLFTEGHVMNDGRMTACCTDATGEWVVGDLRKDSFMDVWHSAEFQSLRAEHLKGNVIGTKCEHCIIYK